METDSTADRPPSPVEAAAALTDVDDARRAVVEIRGPRWTMPLLLVATAALPLGQMLPLIPSLAVGLAFCVALGVAVRAHVTHTGIVYRPEGRWRVRLAVHAAVALAMVVGGGMLEDQAGLWWIWFAVGPLLALNLAVLLHATGRAVGQAQG